MSPSSIIELEINESAQNYAKVYSSLLTDEYQRKRAYASITAIYALINLLEKTNNEVETQTTIFRNPILNEQFEISDLYVNNWHLDVRVITEGNAFLVPKCHFENNIVPDFYVVIKVDKELKTADLIGFADTKSMKKEGFDYHYYSVANTELLNYAEFLTKISTKKQTNFSEADHNLFKEFYLSLIDNEIDKNTRNKILKHLFECRECRNDFCCFSGFEMVNKDLIKYPEILNDQTLNIIGAQAVDEPQYQGKEETIITEDETIADEIQEPAETSAASYVENTEIVETPSPENISEEESGITEENQDGTVADILDDFFGSTEEITENTEETSESKFLDTDDSTPITEEETVQTNETSSQEDDFILIEDTETEDISTNITPDEASDSTPQKVIVDYDEYGEPIYSYISNVETADKTIIQEEDNNGFGEKTTYSETTFETVSDNEYTEIAEENTLSEIKEEPIVESKPIIPTILEEAVQELKKTGNSTRPVSYQSRETYEYVGQSPEESEENYNKNSTYEGYNDQSENLEENTQRDTQEYEETGIDENTEEYQDDSSEDKADADYEDEYEDNYNDEQEDTDVEDEDEDEDDAEDYKQKAAKQNKTVLTFLIILLLACGGAFFVMKNINAANNGNSTMANLENNSGIINDESSNQVNDMFEQPVDNQSEGNVQTDNTVNEQPQNVPNEQMAAGSEPASQENTQENTDFPTSGKIEVPQSSALTEKDLLNQAPTGDVNKVMSNAFSETPNNVTLRSVNWQCAPSLFTNKEFKDYLQKIDNVLKLNLKKNLLNATQTPSNNSITIKLAIDNNGNLVRKMIAASSGSNEIDNIVLQSINETLEVEKTQILSDGDLKAEKYYLVLAIKL